MSDLLSAICLLFYLKHLGNSLYLSCSDILGLSAFLWSFSFIFLALTRSISICKHTSLVLEMPFFDNSTHAPSCSPSLFVTAIVYLYNFLDWSWIFFFISYFSNVFCFSLETSQLHFIIYCQVKTFIFLISKSSFLSSEYIFFKHPLIHYGISFFDNCS